MTSPAVFPYIPLHPAHPVPRPVLPFRAERNGIIADLQGVVDSGAMVSVLPYDVGARFGVAWSSLAYSTTIGGVAGSVPAKLLPLDTTVAPFPPIPLVYAWAQSNTVPLVLGHVDFFGSFEVCFFADKGIFHVRPRTP